MANGCIVGVRRRDVLVDGTVTAFVFSRSSAIGSEIERENESLSVEDWLAQYFHRDTTFVLSGREHVDDVALAIAKRAAKAGGTVVRIKPEHEAPADEAKHFVNHFRSHPGHVVVVTADDVSSWRSAVEAAD